MRTHMLPLAIGGLGTTELLIILAVIILLFGAAKLPELARGSGRALRIFKAETKGLMDDDQDDVTKTPEQRELESRQAELDRRQADLDAERDRLQRPDGA
ncbi:Sec-independent protein translocase subunit TatA [Nocardioides sp.]|uniref:Sec-independent protein translocase subunit TatA n=1 Tax=Nocardioides sp. TaxID=35761 RepID=UPI002627F4D5|nr:Sec-independent protein translocase subunit TatA [Nocardioides sp.]MDI6908359.1 Sec-independent protein translocase subunit TatA [Nocardioides sp.]